MCTVLNVQDANIHVTACYLFGTGTFFILNLLAKVWDDLVRLTLATETRLLFDLDLQQRFGTQWDPTDAIRLFEYCASQGYGKNLDWELGNGT